MIVIGAGILMEGINTDDLIDLKIAFPLFGVVSSVYFCLSTIMNHKLSPIFYIIIPHWLNFQEPFRD